MKLPFGKHKGKEIAKVDPGYLRWVIGNVHWLESSIKLEIHAVLGIAETIPKPQFVVVGIDGDKGITVGVFPFVGGRAMQPDGTEFVVSDRPFEVVQEGGIKAAKLRIEDETLRRRAAETRRLHELNDARLEQEEEQEAQGDWLFEHGYDYSALNHL